MEAGHMLNFTTPPPNKGIQINGKRKENFPT